MYSARVVETEVTNNSPSQDSNQPDDFFQSRYNSYCSVLLPFPIAIRGMPVSLRSSVHLMVTHR